MTAITFIEPDTVADVLEILSANSGAHIVAGGQILVEQLAARQIAPHTLISLRRVSRLCGLSNSIDGSVLIGSMTTHRVLAETNFLRGSHKLLSEAARQIAGPAIRNVATIGGSICCADARLDYPAVLTALDACVRIVGPAGERTLSILDFYAQKGIRDDELLVEVRLPPSPAHSLTLYERVARCEQDMPIFSVAIHASMKRDLCCAVAIAVGSCGPAPVRLTSVERRLRDTSLNENDIADACVSVAEHLNVHDDVRATATYRRMLAPRVVARALRTIAKSIETDHLG